MNDVGWLFVYTPFPWLGLFYITFYRHDLSRLTRPFRDNDNSTMWWSVCRHLGLFRVDSPKPARRVWKSKSFIALVMAATISLLRLVILVPLAWYYLVLLQVASALVLFLVLVNRIGRLPTKLHSDTLPYPRLGTRIRHLSKAKGARFNEPGTFADSQAALSRGGQMYDQ